VCAGNFGVRASRSYEHTRMYEPPSFLGFSPPRLVCLWMTDSLYYFLRQMHTCFKAKPSKVPGKRPRTSWIFPEVWYIRAYLSRGERMDAARHNYSRVFPSIFFQALVIGVITVSAKNGRSWLDEASSRWPVKSHSAPYPRLSSLAWLLDSSDYSTTLGTLTMPGLIYTPLIGAPRGSSFLTSIRKQQRQSKRPGADPKSRCGRHKKIHRLPP